MWQSEQIRVVLYTTKNGFSTISTVFSIEAAVTNFETGSGRGGQQQRGQGGREDSQLRARVQFLTQENEELAQVTNSSQCTMYKLCSNSGYYGPSQFNFSLNVSS